MRILVAPDKFKGTASARTVVDAISRACGHAGHEVVGVALADGGEGTLDAFGGANRESTVTGPLGQPVAAAWRLRGRRAVIEMASAAGLTLAGGAEANDPVDATTTGVGELIDVAVQRGARQIIVGVGGSATTDGGWGAIEALQPVQRLRGVEIIVACDVRTTFVDAAPVFAPQKGATPAQVELLRRRLDRLAQIYVDERGIDVRELPRSGAAGGLAGGLASVGAELVDGFEVVADAVELYEKIEAADLVITGEGAVDHTSLDGKVVGGVIGLAADAGVPVAVVAGASSLDELHGAVVATLTEEVGEARAFADVEAAIEATTNTALARFANGS